MAKPTQKENAAEALIVNTLAKILHKEWSAIINDLILKMPHTSQGWIMNPAYGRKLKRLATFDFNLLPEQQQNQSRKTAAPHFRQIKSTLLSKTVLTWLCEEAGGRFISDEEVCTEEKEAAALKESLNSRKEQLLEAANG